VKHTKPTLAELRQRFDAGSASIPQRLVRCHNAGPGAVLGGNNRPHASVRLEAGDSVYADRYWDWWLADRHAPASLQMSLPDGEGTSPSLTLSQG
jgi:hypothetical protein